MIEGVEVVGENKLAGTRVRVLAAVPQQQPTTDLFSGPIACDMQPLPCGCICTAFANSLVTFTALPHIPQLHQRHTHHLSPAAMLNKFSEPALMYPASRSANRSSTDSTYARAGAKEYLQYKKQQQQQQHN